MFAVIELCNLLIDHRGFESSLVHFYLLDFFCAFRGNQHFYRLLTQCEMYP
jgi:hypothetical protein